MENDKNAAGLWGEHGGLNQHAIIPAPAAHARGNEKFKRDADGVKPNAAHGFQNVGRHTDNVIELADEARKRRIRSPTEFWW